MGAGGDDDGDVLHGLINSMIGDSLEAARDSPPSNWEEWFKRFHHELVLELDHVAGTMHIEVVRALLRELLGRATLEEL